MCLLDDMADLPEVEKLAAVEQLSRLLRMVPVNMETQKEANE